MLSQDKNRATWTLRPSWYPMSLGKLKATQPSSPRRSNRRPGIPRTQKDRLQNGPLALLALAPAQGCMCCWHCRVRVTFLTNMHPQRKPLPTRALCVESIPSCYMLGLRSGAGPSTTIVWDFGHLDVVSCLGVERNFRRCNHEPSSQLLLQIFSQPWQPSQRYASLKRTFGTVSNSISATCHTEATEGTWFV